MKFTATVTLISVLACVPANATITIYKLQSVCKMDIEQYCKDIRRTLIRDMKACLARHETELLPYCQDHYKEAH
jgi:hypothetical protein